MEGRRLVIPDIHGCGKTLTYLLDKVLKVNKADTLYFLGDYIDRGPHNKIAIDKILSLKEAGIPVRCLMGNHEDMLMKVLKEGGDVPVWLMNGGGATLRSFNIDQPEELPEVYKNFLYQLEYYIELEDAFLVHAGFDFDREDILSDREAMLWIRGFSVDPEKLDGKKLIHGHTPVPLDLIKAAIHNDAADINLDNGCVYNRPDMNNLLAFNLDSYELTIQPNIEDTF